MYNKEKIDFTGLEFAKDSVISPLSVSTMLTYIDFWGAFKARLGINRNNYKVEPVLYKVGKPDNNSPVFVTANYKLSFDTLRKNLTGIDCYILVLNTNGINVWCAAGKGTFGTKELVEKIKTTGLEKVVSHRTLILPQLGAVGVSAYQVRALSGFSVKYGPVRASDIKRFMDSNQKATEEMRMVKFTFLDRLKLLPVEIVGSFHYLVIITFVFALLSGISSEGYSFKLIAGDGIRAALNLFIAYFSGCVITPLLMPVIIVRSFALKGFITGIIISTINYFFINHNAPVLEQVGWFFIVPVISSFMMMNFTGSSTYTSLSGVLKEMRFAIPVQIILLLAGITLFIVSKFSV